MSTAHSGYRLKRVMQYCSKRLLLKESFISVHGGYRLKRVIQYCSKRLLLKESHSVLFKAAIA